MKIRSKILWITGIFFSILILVFLFISYKYFLGNVKNQEEEDLQNKMSEIEESLDYEISGLERFLGDWAPWDETYTFIQDKNEEYIDNNLNEDTLANLDVNIILFYDKNNKLFQVNYWDTNSNDITLIKENLKELDKYLPFLLKNEDVTKGTSGIVSFMGRPMLISSRPITNSVFTPPKAGTLIMGKYIDGSLIQKLSRILGTNLSFYQLESNVLSFSQKDNLSNNSYLISLNGYNNISIYKEIKDILGENIFYIVNTQNRKLYYQGLNAILFFIFFFTICCLLLFINLLFLLNKIIINPIENISREVNAIVLDDFSKYSLTVKGTDEFSDLSRDINSMLYKIKTSNITIKKNIDKLNLVFNTAKAGYWEYDVAKDELFLSGKILEILGYDKYIPKIFTQNDWFSKVHKDHCYLVNDSFQNFISGKEKYIFIEYKIYIPNNKYIWISVQGNVSEYFENGSPKKILGIVMDVDDRKNSETELKYLTYYDTLTGLYNRGYYEKYILELESKKKYPYTIIIGDVNGLKLTNDKFGHSTGDKLLCETANLLKYLLPKDVTICRFGGDEFIVILENYSQSLGEVLFENLRTSINNNTKYKVSLSLGFSTKSSSLENIDEIIKEAEEMMCHNKLLETASSRNNTLSLLSKTLFEKSHETEEHANRIFDLCSKIGTSLNLSSSILNELFLLAKLHDIGKIGISDEILNKPSKLNKFEWDVMKTHTEIGYRIASSVPDLAYIAYEILCHHEKYDGTGYPNGLKGDDIPLLSRILTIVDSYDVMTHERPYKNSMSTESAIEELRKCSNTQFDPKLIEIFLKVL